MHTALTVRSAEQDGGSAGLRYLFEPDFSKITSKVILEAMGLSFFTLSVGMGILVTYGGYMPKDQNVTSTSAQMIVLVLIVSLLAGMNNERAGSLLDTKV